ncbi:hypothetical protein CoNPh26_CDS0033 [Staphylococcus phage S-CoN_Ph26]|nr:hypothetical protein CoNPh26_CDS0033 [Staphylococcus phage S-CoN_Ph26]
MSVGDLSIGEYIKFSDLTTSKGTWQLKRISRCILFNIRRGS